jgi:hypothetical protein
MKSEIRRPKAERNPKAEIRSAKVVVQILTCRIAEFILRACDTRKVQGLTELVPPGSKNLTAEKARKPKSESLRLPPRRLTVRVSDFGFLSAFGLRPSDFGFKTGAAL